MDNPLTIKYSNMDRNQDTDLLIQNKFASLMSTYDSIQICRVLVAKMQQYLSGGSNNDSYRVSINLKLAPNNDYFVVRNPDLANPKENPELLINEAFEAISQQLGKTWKLPIKQA